MNAAERFIDTNVVLYLLAPGDRRAELAEREVEAGGVVSVQVLNEFAHVAARKLHLTFAEIRTALAPVRAACEVVPLTEETHDLGLDLVHRHQVPVHDAMIVAAALLAGCRLLLSEDFQHGQRFGALTIRNPFR